MTVTVYKRDHHGQPVWHYEGEVIAAGEGWVCIEARFRRDDVATDYVTFRKNDRMVEWFYTDRGYNIFELHDVEDDHLKGWYCNITRPAVSDYDAERVTAITHDDLALDLFIFPNGTSRLLDEDEFAVLDLTPEERTAALHAVHQLQALVATRTPLLM